MIVTMMVLMICEHSVIGSSPLSADTEGDGKTDDVEVGGIKSTLDFD